jgi:uncharacterized protein (DUF362 family)
MTVLATDSRKNIVKAIHRIFDFFEYKIALQQNFFLKPNIVFPVSGRSGEITPLTLVQAVVVALRERSSSADIVIGEGVAAGCDPLENFRVSGYARLAEQLGVLLVDLHEAERVDLPWKFGTISVPRIVLDRCYISLPILKSSSACVVSGAMKNQKGLVAPAMKKAFHRNGLHEELAQLNAAISPALTIMDCGNFFGAGQLISGDNCGEIDAHACRQLMIHETEHVRLARSAGVFSDGYGVAGEFYSSRRRTMRLKESKTIGRLRYWNNPRACTMCRDLFGDLTRHPFRLHSLKAIARLLRYVAVGAEIITGTRPVWQRKHKSVICVGECTRRIAESDGYRHIPGCPPTHKTFAQKL